MRLIRSVAYWYGLVLPRRLLQLVRAHAYDVVLIQRNLLHRDASPFLERALASLVRVFGHRLVYHCDDALWVVGREAGYRTRIRLADAVLTGNDEIAAYARALNGDVRILEGGLQLENYPSRHDISDDCPVVVGWVGTSPESLVSVAGVLKRLAADNGRVRIKIVTGRVDDVPDLGADAVIERWAKEREFDAFGDLDIGIMPLEDTAYARAKEGFKLKEYMASGIPVVCSPVGHNLRLVRDGVTGLFATTPEEWHDRLTRLVSDKHLRTVMGIAGRASVQRFAVWRQAEILADHLDAIARAPEMASAGLPNPRLGLSLSNRWSRE